MSWNKDKFDHYRRAIVIATFPALALLAYLIGIDAPELVLSDSFTYFVSIPTFFANQLASAAFLGRAADISRAPQKSPKEWLGTFAGIAFGLLATSALLYFQVPVPFAASLFGFANVLFAARQINVFTGLGNRIGRCLDSDTCSNRRPRNEKTAIMVAIVLGTLLATALFATSSAATVSVMGLTAFFNGGASVPLWISGVIFIGTLSSAVGAFADYASKSFNFIRTQFYTSPTDPDAIMLRERFHEYRGSFLGTTIGLLIGVVAVSALSITAPGLITGMVGSITAGLIVMVAATTFGSTFSRFGRVLDMFEEDKPTLQKNYSLTALFKNTSEQSLTTSSTLRKTYEPIPIGFFDNNKISKQRTAVQQPDVRHLYRL